MNRVLVLEKLNDIFQDIIDDEVVVTENSSADDVDDWDSLVHIRLIVAIEKKFKIKFTSREVDNFSKVGDVIDLIEQKTNK